MLFTALVLFSRRGEKIGTAGITKAKECAELVLVNGRGGRGRICRDEIAFAHHREGNGISDLDNGMPRKAQGGSLGKMVVSRSLLEQLADLLDGAAMKRRLLPSALAVCRPIPADLLASKLVLVGRSAAA